METSVNNKYSGFTSVEQGKKLSKILPLTSIDFIWCIFSNGTTRLLRMDDWEVFEYAKHINVEIIPCWSLDALLTIIANQDFGKKSVYIDDGQYNIDIPSRHCKIWFPSLIDAVFELIVWLKENKKL